MRIAFDLDDTLIPLNRRERTLEWLSFPFSFFFKEGLRPGTKELLRRLLNERHELWIYTTSYRSPMYLKCWFGLMGIKISGIVNQGIHRRIVPHLPLAGHSASKYPPAFDIDVLVDDSLGVAEEGRRYGFAVIRIDPEDPEWTLKVLKSIEDRAAGRPQPPDDQAVRSPDSKPS